jgi:ATP/maltotriose-dependent transcriptional regulator MalT
MRRHAVSDLVLPSKAQMSARAGFPLGPAKSGGAMPGPPELVHPRVGERGPDGLLATKLFAPRPQLGFVSRPRLLEALSEGVARGLVLSSAPAGFGKTALLADWTLRRPVAWLSLDAGDNDPARFWRHVIAALDRVRPGIAERVAPLLDPAAPSSFEGLVTALINELADEPDEGEAVLVLDDYHEIDSDAVQTSLTFLLEHRPPELRLVLTSRADPPLPSRTAAGRWAARRAARCRPALHQGGSGRPAA